MPPPSNSEVGVETTIRGLLCMQPGPELQLSSSGARRQQASTQEQVFKLQRVEGRRDGAHVACSVVERGGVECEGRRPSMSSNRARRGDERDDGRDDERGRRRRPASKGGGVGRRGVGTAAVRPSLSVQAGRPFVAWGAQMEASAARNGHRGRPRGASSSTSDAAAAAVSSTSRDRVGATRAQDRADVARPSVEGASAEGRRGVLEHAVVPRWGVERADATAMSGTSTVRIEGGDERGGEPEIAGEQRASGNGGADVAPATARVRRRWRRARERERGDGRGDVESAAACSHFETALEAGAGRVQAGATACVLGRRSGERDVEHSILSTDLSAFDTDAARSRRGGPVQQGFEPRREQIKAISSGPEKVQNWRGSDAESRSLLLGEFGIVCSASSSATHSVTSPQTSATMRVCFSTATTAGIITNGDVGNSGLSREDAAHRRMWSSHVGTAPSGTASWSMYQVLV
ncbi:hypothetical protein C8R45DRAFT_933971 [Mycena sanguinolenta]|nr:hypothetical protein C8R45DRAFT_933971 [Mycena sanguinolenta]